MIKLVGGELYQWDTGRVVETAADIHEVHFSTDEMDFAYVVETHDKEGVTYGNIPNIILQQERPILCYEVRKNETGEETASCLRLKLYKRNRPNDYVYTEEELITLKSLSNRMEELESLRPDYDQNNETSADYIKNRPFYDSRVITYEDVNITYDGNWTSGSCVRTTCGEGNYGAYRYKVSDTIFTKDALTKLVYTNDNGDSFTIGDCYVIETGDGIFCPELNLVVIKTVGEFKDPNKDYGYIYPETGLYFGPYGRSLISPEPIGFVTDGELKKLDRKFIPTDYIDSLIDEGVAKKAEKFTVSISQDDDYNYIADKTFDEIKAAYEAGNIIQCGIWGVYSDIVLAEESSYSFHMLSGYEDTNTYKFYIMIVTVIISQDDTIVVLASNSFCPDDLSTSNFIFQVSNADGGWPIYPDVGLNRIYIRTERNSGIDLVADTSQKQITVSNTGVRSITTGSADGTISVNTNGTAEDVAIKGWPSIPTVTVADAGKFLRVSDTGEWVAETIPSAGGGGDTDALINGSITEITSNAETVRTYMFYNCSGLTSANFPLATSIEENAFLGCNKLITADFLVATEIGRYAFANCVALTTANFPLAANIAENAFDNCKALTSANFPLANSIGNYAFRGCRKLTTIDFLVATEIGSYVFYNCNMLVTVVLRDTEAACTLSNAATFGSTPIAYDTGYIYVPSALLDTYKAATNWTTYADQFRALESYTVDGTTTGALDESKI